LCSGKIFHELDTKRAEMKLQNKVAMIRIEELSPFPYKAIEQELSKYATPKSIMWVQEEHENMGAYCYVAPRLKRMLEKRGIELQYVGRKASSCAVGITKLHKQEASQIFQDSFKGL
jgi:2-oxoglutarate dehydrogenase complex dehydrogenase (E1) component-like enzyme